MRGRRRRSGRASGPLALCLGLAFAATGVSQAVRAASCPHHREAWLGTAAGPGSHAVHVDGGPGVAADVSGGHGSGPAAVATPEHPGGAHHGSGDDPQPCGCLGSCHPGVTPAPQEPNATVRLRPDTGVRWTSPPAGREAPDPSLIPYVLPFSNAPPLHV